MCDFENKTLSGSSYKYINEHAVTNARAHT